MQSEIMTDHQFARLIKVAIKFIEASYDKEEAIEIFGKLIKDNN